MKGLKFMSLTLAASTIAFSLSQIAHAEQIVDRQQQSSSYENHANRALDSYEHHGNAGENATFLFNSQFIKALDSGHLNFNGYNINQDNDDNIQYKKVYDQEVRATSDHTAASVSFIVKDQSVTINQMKKAYNNSKLNHIPHTTHHKDYPNDGVYVYHGEQIQLQFRVDEGYVTTVIIGQGENE